MESPVAVFLMIAPVIAENSPEDQKEQAVRLSSM